MRCSQRLQTVHMKRIFFYIKAYIPHALDLLNQSDKIFTNIEEQPKLFLYNLFNMKKKNSFARFQKMNRVCENLLIVCWHNS